MAVDFFDAESFVDAFDSDEELEASAVFAEPELESLESEPVSDLPAGLALVPSLDPDFDLFSARESVR